MILLGGLLKADMALSVSQQVLHGLQQAFCIEGRDLMVTASVGIAIYPQNGHSASELLRNADSAMYHSKELGRNHYAFFTDEMNQIASRRLALEEQMLGAIDRGEFKVLYQPQFDIQTNRIVGVEALLRWHNPALGAVSPAEFIPVAEQTALIIELGQFVIRDALQQCSQWVAIIGQAFRTSVNFSPRQFRDPNILQNLDCILEDFNLNPCLLDLEFTEGLLLSSDTLIADTLQKLNQRGISLSMDDFGTGYSSLSYLRNFPFETVKIDITFIRDIADDPADKELVSAAIAMAHGLNMQVVAEGVETVEQLQILKQLDCDLAQGYLLGKPMPSKSISRLLKEQNHKTAQKSV